MYEIVKIINGYEIKRMVGSRGWYRINIREDNGTGFCKFLTFRTIKEAAEFAALLPEQAS